MQSSIQRIGVIGLGHMGSDYASNLMADGFQIKVYDRNEKHTDPLVARGATAAAGPGDLAGCEAVLTSLPDDDALTNVTLRDDGLIHVLGRGAIHVSMSTVRPGLSRRLAHEHELAGQGYVAAPVLGNPDLAEARKLFVIVAGASPEGPGFAGARPAWATVVFSGGRSRCRQSHESGGQCPHGSYLAKHGRGFGVAAQGRR
jgi:3-hydroxyisobutyrate dehydrogenase-like beta-hydroxyacid dehydrogenase